VGHQAKAFHLLDGLLARLDVFLLARLDFPEADILNITPSAAFDTSRQRFPGGSAGIDRATFRSAGGPVPH
jgi:hypothetical protein